MTTRQHTIHLILQILACLAALASGLMAMDAQVHPLLGLNPQLALWWPVVLAGAGALGKFANALSSAFVLIWPDQQLTTYDAVRLQQDAAVAAGPKPRVALFQTPPKGS